MGGGCLLGLYVDGKLAGTFEAGETATFVLPAKTHLLGTAFPPGRGMCAPHSGERRELETVLAPGEIKYYRIVVREGDGAALEPTTYR
jgi:hypothetical protein